MFLDGFRLIGLFMTFWEMLVYLITLSLRYRLYASDNLSKKKQSALLYNFVLKRIGFEGVHCLPEVDYFST